MGDTNVLRDISALLVIRDALLAKIAAKLDALDRAITRLEKKPAARRPRLRLVHSSRRGGA